jgi:hypothetical protein
MAFEVPSRPKSLAAVLTESGSKTKVNFWIKRSFTHEEAGVQVFLQIRTLSLCYLGVTPI